MIYEYVTLHPFEKKISYSYAEINENNLFEAWKTQRNQIKQKALELTDRKEKNQDLSNFSQIQNIKLIPNSKYFSTSSTHVDLKKLLKKFEINGNITLNDYNFTSDDYIHFLYLLKAEYKRYRKLNILNCFIKCMDHLVSFQSHLLSSQKLSLIELIDSEREFVLRLGKEKYNSDGSFLKVEKCCNSRKIGNGEISLLLADTVRSKVYLTEIIGRGIIIENIILLKSNKRDGQLSDKKAEKDIFPDHLIYTYKIEELCQKYSNKLSIVNTETVNSDHVLKELSHIKSDLIVFSGFGGDIVKPFILESVKRLLHCHSGWLPDFKGSTTLYYSILSQRPCAVSAIYLKACLDGGPIIRMKEFPAPGPNVNIDYWYDNHIRSQVLCDVLEEYQNTKIVPLGEPSHPDKGEMYFIIHPVLKSVALKKLGY